MSEQSPSSLALINDVLQAIIVIFSASVLLYNLRFLFRDRVTRAFNALIFFVIIVFFTELLATRTTLAGSAEIWIRIGWIGIAMIPAAQFHLADALLETTGAPSRNRKLLSRVWYLVGILFFTLAIFSDLIITNPSLSSNAPHMNTGILFPLFAVYYWFISGASIYLIGRARAMCVTKTTRKRMTMIFITILAAPLAVFPYLTISGDANVQSSVMFWLVIILGNIVISIMFALLTYYMSYFGALSPDRVVRVRLFKYMARIPLAASIVLLVYVAVVQAEQILGLHLETALAIAIVASVILVEWAIYAFKRPLERLFQLTDEPEVRRIQQLSERVLTTRDLRQFLESVLAAACDVLRTPSAFAASISADGPKLEAVIGLSYAENDQWSPEEWQLLAQSAGRQNENQTDLHTSGDFVLWGNYWIRPLHTQESEILVGILGVEARSTEPDLNENEEETFERLVNQATVALQDRLLQQEVFSSVEGLLPQVTAIQRTRSAATFGGTKILTSSEDEAGVLADPDFNNIVWDALSHYWGGPKLTHSPLMRLRVVQESVRSHGGNQTKALREILQKAVERQRPVGERSMTTAEWILYNILELKFIQGQKVRDVARRLAMSESDLYRKQRVAIENVAGAISEMEEAALFDEDNIDTLAELENTESDPLQIEEA